MTTLGSGAEGSGRSLFDGWLEELQRRYLTQFEFAEVRRAVQALSWRYVEGRREAAYQDALGTRGKRAAYAVFYAPLHFLVVANVVEHLSLQHRFLSRIVELGCGTGVAGSAWAVACGGRPKVVGIDLHPWCVAEAKWTYSWFGLRSVVRQADLLQFGQAGKGDALLAAYVLNELDDSKRSLLAGRLSQCVRRGACFLVVEPMARSVCRWLDVWEAEFSRFQVRLDEWRFSIELPPLLALLDRAAGLGRGEGLTARSLWVEPK